MEDYMETEGAVDYWYFVWFLGVSYFSAHVFPVSFSDIDAKFKDRWEICIRIRDWLHSSLPAFYRGTLSDQRPGAIVANSWCILFAVGVGLVQLIIQAVVVLLTIVTFGIGTICIMPLMLLLYPALYGAIVWMEQSMNAIIVDNMTIMDAAKQGWKLLRNNLMSMALLALVIYLGAGLVTGVLMMPMLVPFFIVPFGFMENQTDWTMLSIAILWIVALIPVFAIITGLSMLFTKSAWVLTYLHLTRPMQSQPLLGSAEATA
jgi:hypothetical protein